MIPHLEISTATLLLALLGALSLGFSKTGLPGLALLNVIIMAQLFGKLSVGIILPLLVLCDLVIYPMYRRFASWRQVWPLLIPAIVGVLLGYLVLKQLNDETTKTVIGWIILAMLILQIARTKTEAFLRNMPDSTGFLIGSGLAIGVSTTVANAAGPAFSIWGLIKQLSKEDFLGIGARFFLFVNLFKIPFIWDADIITRQTLMIDLALAPAVLVGIAIGRSVIMRIPQKAFEIILLLVSALGAVWLICF